MQMQLLLSIAFCWEISYQRPSYVLLQRMLLTLLFAYVAYNAYTLRKTQPRSQGLSSSHPLERETERLWERG